MTPSPVEVICEDCGHQKSLNEFGYCQHPVPGHTLGEVWACGHRCSDFTAAPAAEACVPLTQHEDELPIDMTQEEYDRWFAQSKVIDGVRMGPKFPPAPAAQNLAAAIADMNSQPDVSGDDSDRLRGFCRMTAVEVKATGGVSAATSLEMIGYIRELEWRLNGKQI